MGRQNKHRWRCKITLSLKESALGSVLHNAYRSFSIVGTNRHSSRLLSQQTQVKTSTHVHQPTLLVDLTRPIEIRRSHSSKVQTCIRRQLSFASFSLSPFTRSPSTPPHTLLYPTSSPPNPSTINMFHNSPTGRCIQLKG